MEALVILNGKDKNALRHQHQLHFIAGFDYQLLVSIRIYKE
jgi:hypothetical protein